MHPSHITNSWLLFVIYLFIYCLWLAWSLNSFVFCWEARLFPPPRTSHPPSPPPLPRRFRNFKGNITSRLEGEMKSFHRSLQFYFIHQEPLLGSTFTSWSLLTRHQHQKVAVAAFLFFFLGVCLFVCVHEGWWVCWMIHQPRANSQYLEQHKRRESRPDWWTTKEKVLEHVSRGDVKRVINLFWNWYWGFTDPSVALKLDCTAIESRRKKNFEFESGISYTKQPGDGQAEKFSLCLESRAWGIYFIS